MPTDLKILAAFTVACSLLFAAVAIAELQRFSPPRHRRRLSASDWSWQVRKLGTGLWWKALGLLTLAMNLVAAAAAASFPVLRPDRSVR